MNIQEEIFRSIESILEKHPSSAPVMDFPTIILGAEGKGKYKVKINGVDRTVKDGIGLNPAIGTSVWVHAMNGDFGQLYIIGRR